jgi:malonyl-CoA O-methyltransferase
MPRTNRMAGLEALLARKSLGRSLRRILRPPEVATEQMEVREAYRLWASTYASETVVCSLDDELAHVLLDDLPQSRLLDAGCGVGHRIHHIPGAVGIDLSAEMLAAGGAQNVVSGDIRAMPFGAGEFDMVWCRLVSGYLQDPLPAYEELYRVCMPGGYVFVTDFHLDAIMAGHRRTFNDEAGVTHEISNYVHTNHEELGSRAGLGLVAVRDGAVGPLVRDLYVRGLGRKAYIKEFGLNLVRAYLFRRPLSSAKTS